MARAPLFLLGSVALTLEACAPAVVGFECADDSTFCDLVEILQDPRPAATGIDITAVALYQGSEVMLYSNDEGSSDDDDDGPPFSPFGDPTEEAPLVAGRDALFRVFVSPHDDFEARDLTLRTYLYRDGDLLTAVQETVSVGTAASSDFLLESTLNVELPASVNSGDLELELELVEASANASYGGEEGVWQVPESGSLDLEFVDNGGLVRLYLIPLEYTADGSGRLPDTSDAQIQTYWDHMYGFYPAADIEIEVGEPMAIQNQVTANGMGWSEVLSQVTAARNELGVGRDVYLYGLLAPTETMDEFCGGGCVTGLSNLAMSASDANSRASIGLGFTGTTAATTMVHEVGHAHGLSHASGCGAEDVDPAYPDPEGHLDNRGYDLVGGTLYEAATTYDMMSYCSPVWISAYHFGKLSTRIEEVNLSPTAGGAVTDWWVVWAHTDGHLTWGPDRALSLAPEGLTREVELLDEVGEVVDTVSARFSPFLDLPGGVLLFQEPAFAVDRVRFEGAVTPPRVEFESSR